MPLPQQEAFAFFAKFKIPHVRCEAQSEEREGYSDRDLLVVTTVLRYACPVVRLTLCRIRADPCVRMAQARLEIALLPSKLAAERAATDREGLLQTGK